VRFDSFNDDLPEFCHALVSHPCVTWLVLGAMDIAAVLLCYASLTRPMPRWCGIVTWFALPLCIGLTMLYLVFFASRLLQRVH
jgi:hypothetical protein